MILEVYDLECLRNLFTYTGYCPKEDKYYQFCICEWRNDLKELYTHLKRDEIFLIILKNINIKLDKKLLKHYILNLKK